MNRRSRQADRDQNCIDDKVMEVFVCGDERTNGRGQNDKSSLAIHC
jgi:hypothetical protein